MLYISVLYNTCFPSQYLWASKPDLICGWILARIELGIIYRTIFSYYPINRHYEPAVWPEGLAWRFNISTRPFGVTTRQFGITARRFGITTRLFDITTRLFDITTLLFDITIRRFDITTWQFDVTIWQFDITVRRFDFDTDLTLYINLNKI